MGNTEEKRQSRYLQTEPSMPEAVTSRKEKTMSNAFPPLKKLQCRANFHKTAPILVEDSGSVEPEEESAAVQQTKQQGDADQPGGLLQKTLSSEGRHEEKVEVMPNLFVKIKKKSYLEDYIFNKEIGKGSNSQVIKAKTKFGTQSRAIKIIKQSKLLQFGLTKQALCSQFGILLELDHPNISKTYEIFEWKQTFAISMELCEGGDLFKHIKNQKKFSEATAAAMFKQIISGVYYMHKHNICHRDIKPENILYDDESKQLKIVDFGKAARIRKQGRLKGKVGTLYYTAPQVFTGDYNQLCDVWSCGVMLYIILCGFPPFQGRNDRQIKQKILFSPLEFNHSIWSKRSSQSRNLISKMLNKDPKKRISAEDVLSSGWFQKILRESSNNTEINGQVLVNLKNFYFKNKLKAVVYSFIASQLYSNKDKENLLKVFKLMDKDGDGVIERHELVSAFQNNQSTLSDLQIERVLEVIDTNASGKIDFTEFLVAASNQEHMLKKKQLEAAFSYLDTDHSGFITIEEVHSFLDGSLQTEQEIRQIFKEVDENGDGKISKNEFVALLLQQQSLKLKAKR